MSPRTDGIDVSQWQGTIDWAAVQRTGIQWVGMRATIRGSVDDQFARNRTGASWARWRLLYDYMSPGGNADVFLATIGQLQLGEAAMLDAEAAGLTVADCVRWCTQVEARTGRSVVVYTGRYTAGGSIWSSSLVFNGHRARVFPAYTSETNAKALAMPYGWDAWQWTDKGTVPGIGPPVDLDQIDDPAAFDRCCWPNDALTGADAQLIAEAVWG